MYKKLIIAFALIVAPKALAYDLGLYNGDFLKVNEMYVEYRKYETYKNPYLPDQTDWQFTGEFHNNLTAFNVLFWDTNLHLSMANDRVRYVGLEYYLGLHATPWLDVIKYHHSQHVLEQTNTEHFPLEDSYGFRVYFKH